MTSQTGWYQDPSTLLNELRRERAERGQPPSIAGYDDIHELRRGGQGVVYRAVQRSTRRKVAIKVLLDGAFASSSARRRFEREIDLVAALRHPGIVQVYDSGTTDDGRLYLVMEFIDGSPLDEHIREQNGGAVSAHKRETVRDILQLFAAIGDAVNFAHQRGVIHRDLKPSNIRVDRDGHIHILDFGLAKHTGGTALEFGGSSAAAAPSITGQFVGSLPWASPEQAEGLPGLVDVRTDVYSLGVMLFHALTGTFPYPVTGAMRGVLANIAQVEAPRASTLVPQLDADIDTIISKCLAKEPERRYQTAGELARDLERHLAGEPIEARRDSTWYVVGRTLRRHKLAAGALAGVFAMSLLVAAVMSIMYGQTLAARNAETEARRAAEHSAEEARAIGAFLEEMLASADPSFAQGRDVGLLRELLDEAARRLDRESGDQPLVAASLQHTIGATYLSLGLYDDAERLLQSALHHRSQMLGEQDPQTLATRNVLGRLLMARGDPRAAEKFVRDTRRLAGAALGDDHVETLRAEHVLAQLAALFGQHDRAESGYRAVWTIRRERLGPHHRETLQVLNDLSGILLDRGKPRDAEALYGDFPAMLEEPARLNSPESIAALGNLALAIARQGRYSEAEPIYRTALDASLRVYGSDHPVTLVATNNLASFLHAQGRLVEAEELYRSTLDVQQRILGADHRDTLSTVNNLAQLLNDSGRLTEAEPLMRQILEADRRKLGESHPHTLLFKNNLANLLERTGRADEAEPLYREVLESRRTVLGREHPDTLVSANNLAMLLVTKGANDEAELLMREVVETRRRVLGESALDTYVGMNNLGALLLSAGRAAEALPIFEELVPGVEASLPAGHWVVPAFRANLGRCLGRLGRFEEGEAILLQALGEITAARGADDEQTRRVVSKLIELYEAWNKPEQAETYRARLPAPSP